MKDTCSNCAKPLAGLHEIVAMQGELYCGKTCAKAHLKREYFAKADEATEERYNEYAEIVSPVDIGIMSEAVKGLVQYIQHSQGLDEKRAIAVASAMLDDLDELVETTLEDLKL